MLLHTGDGPNLLMSIPRDSLVEIPGHGTTKINAAYAFGGPKLLVKTIEQNTGIRIDHYVEIGFGGFVELGRRGRRHRDLPDQTMKDKLRQPRHQEGLPGGRRRDRARLRAVPAHVSASATSTGPGTSARWSRAVGEEVMSPWTFINPVRYWRVNMAVPDVIRVRRGHRPDRAGRSGPGDDQGQRRDGLTCGVPIADLGGALGPGARARSCSSYIKEDTHRRHPEGACARRPACPKSVTG